MNIERLIINSPDLQTLRQRYAGRILTLLLWLAWFYLLLPLLSLLLWVFGVQIAYEHMVSLGGLDGLRQLIHWYALAIALIALSWIAWSQYNRIRYGHRPRKSAARATHIVALGAFFGVSSADIATARRAGTLWVQIGDTTHPAPHRLSINPDLVELRVAAPEQQGFRGRRGDNDPFLARRKPRRRPRRRANAH